MYNKEIKIRKLGILFRTIGCVSLLTHLGILGLKLLGILINHEIIHLHGTLYLAVCLFLGEMSLLSYAIVTINRIILKKSSFWTFVLTIFSLLLLMMLYVESLFLT